MTKLIDWRGRPPYASFLGGPMFPNGSEFTVDDVIPMMDEKNIAIGVAPFRKGMDNADGEKLMAEYGDRFRYLAHLDPYDSMEFNIAEMEKYVLNGHAAGIIVEPSMKFIKAPLFADDQKMLYPIYEYCQAHEILVTITYGGLWTANVDYYQPIHADNLAKDFPKLRIVLAHGGWPYTAEICHVAYQRGNLYLSPELYAVPGFQPGGADYMAAANNWLQDRIVFGTGVAYPGPEGMLQMAIDGYKQHLNESVQDKIFYHNAATLLGLEPKPPIINVLGDRA